MPRSVKRGAKHRERREPEARDGVPNANLVDYTVALSRSVLVRGAVRGQVDPNTIEDRLARQRKRFAQMPPSYLAAVVLTNLADHDFHFT